MSKKPTARKNERKITAATKTRQSIYIFLQILANFLAFRPSWSGEDVRISQAPDGVVLRSRAAISKKNILCGLQTIVCIYDAYGKTVL